ncbi:MAG TPA: patatin-like phospholipase family protein, partial [Ohtaekwangia sp.]
MSKPTFYVGLCMAGAVSAGAYTAGVVDYLIEALDNWEKNRGKDGIPDHLVSIPVIGGASAGGMTGILTASAINNVIPHVSTMGQSNAIENKFWHTWVDLLKDDMFPELLKTNDIKEGKILSLFNSSFIDKIAARFVNVDAAHWIERPYFKDLKIFTTLTSLKGLSFNIGLLGSGENRDQYCVSRHNDYACFKLNDNTYSNDGWIPLDFRVPETVKLAGDAAMATGAFPV